MIWVIGKVKVMDFILIGCIMDVVEVECSGLVLWVVLVDDLLIEVRVIVMIIL